MNFEPGEVESLIAEGEGKQLEFKRWLPRDVRVARTLCAFANTRGGLLLIGVGDRGELVGAPRPRETMQQLRVVARGRLEPGLEVQVGAVLVGGLRVVWCSVPISPDRPHAVVGDAGEREIVARVGSSNRRASGATLAAIRAQRAAGAQLDELERRVLRWVERHDPRGGATVLAFAREHNVGLQRARRAFTRLELAGRLVAHGAGPRRVYALA